MDKSWTMGWTHQAGSLTMTTDKTANTWHHKKPKAAVTGKYVTTRENQRTAARIMVKAAKITGEKVPEHVKALAAEK